jgi:hypothetical protein
MDTNEEYVYVVSNPSLQNAIKIGFTTRHPSERVKELSGTSLPTEFIIEFVIITKPKEGRVVEQKIHDYLNSYRINNSREFFNISIESLKEILVNELHLEPKLMSEIHIPEPKLNKYNNILNKKYNEIKKEIYIFLNKIKNNYKYIVVKKCGKKYIVSLSKEPIINRDYFDEGDNLEEAFDSLDCLMMSVYKNLFIDSYFFARELNWIEDANETIYRRNNPTIINGWDSPQQKKQFISYWYKFLVDNVYKRFKDFEKTYILEF